MYTIIGYDNKIVTVFDYFKEYMPESQFGMKCTEFLQLRQIQIAGIFKDCFFFSLYLFSRTDLNHVNMKNILQEYSRIVFLFVFRPSFKDRLKRCEYEKHKYTWVYAHQTKWTMGGNTAMTISGTSLSFISSGNV